MALADSYQLPALARLQRDGLVATLDNGTAHRTGLTGEHLSTGRDPAAAQRSSAVLFDPHTYQCVQEGTRGRPLFGEVRTVIFDMAYFDLDRAHEGVVGISDWGVHDPGGSPQQRPESLRAELEERFGAYPARQWIYGVPWASPAASAEMGRALTAAVDTRGRIARWLLAERFTDWNLALIGFAESHNASEGLFHGSGMSHPWDSLESTPQARDALRSVYTAIDRAVGEIVDAFPQDTVVVFSMHGMGANNSDVPSMALLGEVMARWSGLQTESARPFILDAHGIPILPAHLGWTQAVLDSLTGQEETLREKVRRVLKNRVPPRVLATIKRLRGAGTHAPVRARGSLMWMPLMRHRDSWPQMKAFAVPSFYDGRIRVNLAGREAQGVVAIEDYDTVLTEIEALLRSCTESRSGRPIVEAVHRVAGNPLDRRDDDVDLIVLWAEDVLGVSHPDLGVIGPVPPRRTGGHVSAIGRCMIVGPGVRAGDIGIRSSFDVVPTIMRLAGTTPTDAVSGHPILVPSQ